MDYTAQTNGPPVRRWSDHVGALNAAQLFQHGRRTVAQARTRHPTFQRLAQHIGQETDQQVRLNAAGRLVPDRANAQIGLVHAEGGLGIGEMHVGTPQLFRIPIRNVAAQQVATLAGLRPGPRATSSRPAQAGAAVGAFFDLDAEQPGRTAVLSQQSSHATLDVAHRATLSPTGRSDLPEPGDNARHETLTHGLFLGGAHAAATENEGLDASAVRTALHL